jgi:hypothetical protein
MSIWKKLNGTAPDQTRIDAAVEKLNSMARDAGADPASILDQLRAALIGPNYKWYISRFDTGRKSFIWPAALLGPLWFGWRKMPGLAATKLFFLATFIAMMIRYAATSPNFTTAAPFIILLTIVLGFVSNGWAALETFRVSVLTKMVEVIESSVNLDQVSKNAYVVGGVGFGGVAAGIGGLAVGALASMFVISTFFPITRATSAGTAVIAPSPGRVSVPQRALCEVHEVQVAANSFVVRNQMDFGYTLKGIVRNSGPDATLQLVATLSTSEGEYQRARSLYFKSGGVMNVSFDYHEPTVNAANIQGRIGCRS